MLALLFLVMLNIIYEFPLFSFKIISRYFLTLFFLPLITTAQQDSIDVFISNQMKQQGIMGLSVGIVKNGKVVKAKGYGPADKLLL